MSEKAACPRCDSYISQVYYDECDEHCGWNCHVEYTVSAYGPTGYAQLSIKTKPTPEQRTAVAAMVDADSVAVSVLVNGSEPRHLSPWLDPDQPDPEPLSQRKAQANLRALKKAHRDSAMRELDARFPGV